ncbi:TetR/AcrR family transcriptional regulator [Falsigemmobacter intermedius]|uniref:TetR/AcrR family transcriptional regulator n=2 Tax=Falsigemmobacter intermedius TaxID=1553448 RepID=A0A444MF38_9RHOB|nr:TetR/AcrR family transcriptional regulator [Falsigemmobacter intermedius]
MRGKMREPAADKVTAILETAAELFASKGYEATSMRDIAQGAGVSKSLLYHHFTDKYQIFTRITSQSGLGLNEAVARAIPKEASASEQLEIFMRTTADFFEENRLSWISASQEFWTSNEAQMSLQMKLRRDSFETMLRRILEEGVKRGEFQISDVRLAGRMILSSLNWMYRWYNPAGSRAARDIAGEYYRMIAFGITPRGEQG